ncbi:type II toxin-antitoxin system PemK/MazF family toxin [Actinotalea sp. K2]|uniref:type II toxin-antitoxin system PemK/MazF family toxin n=1 Tax=Actinotalea sp. K2 TaxID=2939438 RepID=UPI0020177758|nr:type II toxin-antitoxin system PemK/MazF family toxin [Actinotalea sp. K2]MCL3861688.1 type II toxin-antitoxin system PemK/MazF family toxin [Actinotalea sp. K2]
MMGTDDWSEVVVLLGERGRELVSSPALVAGVLGLLLLLTVLGARRRRGPRPAVGEIWFARVPYRDGTGRKDRPVLVLAVGGRRCTVASFTSQDQGVRGDHVRVPDGIPGLSRTSWVSTRPVRLPRSAMRRRTGAPGEALVAWYEDAVEGRRRR